LGDHHDPILVVPPVGPVHEDSGLVFTHPDGSPMHSHLFSDWFKQHVRTAGLPVIRLHDLRHSYATVALAADIPAKVVSERLGHATIAITMDTYSHVLPGLDESCRDRGAADPGRRRARAERVH
jgi:integrase